MTKVMAMRIIFLVLCVFLSACLPEKKNRLDVNKIEIIEGKVSNQEYFIPEPYFYPGSHRFIDNDVLLLTMYPNFLPLDKAPKDYWKEGSWWRNIIILISSRQNPTILFDEAARKSTQHLHATVFVGEDYGLYHFTQSENSNRDAYDVWFEKSDNQIVSYITCGEKVIKEDIPQCSHWFLLNENLSLKIDYDRRFLPKWKIIEGNVKKMIESFGSPKAAKEFLRQRTELSQAQPQERIP